MTLTRRALLRASGAAALVSSLGCDRVERALLAGLRPPPPAAGPFQAPLGESLDTLRHLLERLSFGSRPEDYGRLSRAGGTPDEAAHLYLEEQLHPETLDDDVAEWAVRRLETLRQPAGELFEYKPPFLLGEMCRGKVLRAVYSRRQLFEVMVDFWTDHFNIDVSKGDCKWLKAADDREVIRAHALGSFPELLRASALSPAMLWYLDGRVNRRAEPGERPNENYARELLELHTLGVDGGYSQRDVMEVARCLTGWTVRSEERFGKGRVEFRSHLHDDGAKIVLGQEIAAGGGTEDLDRVLALVALHPSTARFVAGKLCRRFVADEPPAAVVSAVADTFLSSRGDIRSTLRSLFSHAAFLEQRGNRLKRPFHFVVSALRATAAETDGHATCDYLLRLGHAPFQYPTPDGYPLDPSPWLGTLLWRWNFAAALAANRLPGTRIDAGELRRQLGGDEKLVAQLLGRRARPAELATYPADATGLALLLASPDFQRT